jgi:hypothetical protein
MKSFVLILLCFSLTVDCFNLPSWFSSFLWNDDRVLEIDTSVDWWENGIFYQIFPRSFKDSNNDGIGDLRGIISKLPYLKELGVTGITLGPIFSSPNIDFGYDIADYRNVDFTLGTQSDLRELFAKAKELDLKIVLDMVPNHTSDQHPWFQKSVNRETGFENLYVWRGCTQDRMPNNWVLIITIDIFKNKFNPMIRFQNIMHQCGHTIPYEMNVTSINFQQVNQISCTAIILKI